VVVTANHRPEKEVHRMSTTVDNPTTPTTAGTIVNARGEAVFLTAETYTLTARQVVLALAAHLARFGDTLHIQVVDPLCAIDAVMRFDGGDLTGWMTHRTPADVAAIRARADTIARDYFGTWFPAVPW
jgi:hypothetical protein